MFKKERKNNIKNLNFIFLIIEILKRTLNFMKKNLILFGFNISLYIDLIFNLKETVS